MTKRDAWITFFIVLAVCVVIVTVGYISLSLINWGDIAPESTIPSAAKYT